RWTLRRTEQRDEGEAREEAADVRPPGDAAASAALVAADERRRPHPELHQEPEEKIEESRDLDERKEEKERDDGDDAGARVEDEVRPEHSGDRPRGADVRHRRERPEERLEERRESARGEVEDEVAEVA